MTNILDFIFSPNWANVCIGRELANSQKIDKTILAISIIDRFFIDINNVPIKKLGLPYILSESKYKFTFIEKHATLDLRCLRKGYGTMGTNYSCFLNLPTVPFFEFNHNVFDLEEATKILKLIYSEIMILLEIKKLETNENKFKTQLLEFDRTLQNYIKRTEYQFTP